MREIELKPYCEDFGSYCVYVNGEHIYNLMQTCGACPEQYDLLSVYDMSTKAYFRLRYGHFRVDCPDVGGETVYEYYGKDVYQGCFDSQSEREEVLRNAIDKVVEYYG